MFAPQMKAPEAKTASQAPPAHAAQLLQHRTAGTPAGSQSHAAEPDRGGTPAIVQRPSWDFSKIRVFSPDRPSGPEARPMLLQRKLAVGQVDDPLEHEADRVAEQVMRMPAWDVSAAAAPAKIRRKCAECEVEEEKLQRKEAGLQAATGEAPASVHEVLRSPGRPLDDTTRAYFEPRLGQDFRYVRVHVDARAAESARGVNAYAYTVGHNMVFDAGRFAPGTHEGRRLIAHELTHVVQQRGSEATVQRAPTPAADPSAERPAAPIPIEEQLDAQLEAEDALGLKWSKRKDKSYAWSLGLKDRARIRKNWKMSPKLQQEITVKVRFFEGEARVAYLRTIGPALEEFPEEAIEILEPPPSAEKPCPIGQTILVYQGKPGQGRCITENDTEFRQNYIDNYIVQADALAIPNTTWENVDRDRVPQMQLTYKDGRTLVIDIKDIPGGVSFRKPGTMGLISSLARYEKRSDGFIYPIRSAGESDYVSYGDAQNIMSLRAGLYERIEELKLGFQLIETGVAFGSSIAALGGIASLNRPGGLFQRVPRKQTKTNPKTPPKRTDITEGEETQSTGVFTEGEVPGKSSGSTVSGKQGGEGGPAPKVTSSAGEDVGKGSPKGKSSGRRDPGSKGTSAIEEREGKSAGKKTMLAGRGAGEYRPFSKNPDIGVLEVRDDGSVSIVSANRQDALEPGVKVTTHMNLANHPNGLGPMSPGAARYRLSMREGQVTNVEPLSRSPQTPERVNEIRRALQRNRLMSDQGTKIDLAPPGKQDDALTKWFF